MQRVPLLSLAARGLGLLVFIFEVKGQAPARAVQCLLNKKCTVLPNPYV